MARREKNPDFVEAVAEHIRSEWKRPHLKIGPGKPSRESQYFYIYDPLFVVRQRQGRLQDRGRYTTGFHIHIWDDGDVYLGFRTEFCRQVLEDLKSNMTTKDVKTALQKLFKIPNDDVVLMWSSKKEAAETKNKRHTVKCHEPEFRQAWRFVTEYLSETDFVDDLGVKMPNTYHKPAVATKDRGTLLWIFAVLNRPSVAEACRVASIMEPLFTKCYPASVETSRNSSLRGRLRSYYRANDLRVECAHKGCDVHKLSDLHAHHIVAYHKGGSDEPANGVFLCHEHHALLGPASKAKVRSALKPSVVRHTVLRTR